ncbi:MAG: hypothetical protein NT020_00415 [Chloroflexales bacterium]|nr:hypothetical protein [Chloroflexales bacterium]
MTTIDELYAQVNALPPDQRATLIARLLHDATPDHASDNQLSWGQNIVRLIESMPPIEMTHPEIEDPVEWVKQIREDKRRRRLGDWGE